MCATFNRNQTIVSGYIPINISDEVDITNF